MAVRAGLGIFGECLGGIVFVGDGVLPKRYVWRILTRFVGRGSGEGPVLFYVRHNQQN